LQANKQWSTAMLRPADFPSRNLPSDRNYSALVQRSESTGQLEDAESPQEGCGIARTALALATMLAITIGVIGVKFLVWGTSFNH
jgi:hypothetical protein